MVDVGTILALWDAAQGPPHRRAARLLVAMGEGDPACLTLGEAARRLLSLHADLLGESRACLSTCPACGALNEGTIAPRELALVPADATPVVAAAEGWRAAARPLTLADFEAAATSVDVAAAAALLCERALVAIDRPEGVPAGQPLPESLVEAIGAALDRADPLTEPSIAFVCAACGEGWDVALDPALLLAEELRASARRAASEVALLARAFGWSESQILALSPARRRLYLELAG